MAVPTWEVAAGFGMASRAHGGYPHRMSMNLVKRIVLGALLGCMGLSVWAEGAVTPVVNREYLPAVLALINSATNSIDYLHLEQHDGRAIQVIEAALGAAVKRGVAVRGLLDDGIDFNAAAVERMVALGADVRLDTPQKMLHSKLVVVDGKAVLLGSTNWTGNSMGNNNETNLRLDDPILADLFERYVAALWADSAAEPALPSVESGSVKTIINRQYFPEVLGLLNGATQRIRVVMYGINYSPKYAGSKVNQLVEALAAAHDRGVDVAVAMDLSDYNTTLNRVNGPAKDYLAAAGVAVYDDAKNVTTHAKVVLADDAVVIGSVNWGMAALEQRNETCVVVQDAAVADFFAAYFERPSLSATKRPAPQPASPNRNQRD